MTAQEARMAYLEAKADYSIWEQRTQQCHGELLTGFNKVLEEKSEALQAAFDNWSQVLDQAVVIASDESVSIANYYAGSNYTASNQYGAA